MVPQYFIDTIKMFNRGSLLLNTSMHPFFHLLITNYTWYWCTDVLIH